MATERSVLVRLKADVSDFVRGMNEARRAIDTTNDRVAWMTQSILAVGPALVPVGASMVPVLSGVAAQATIAGGAAGTMALAFVGVGDALEKLNKYQLDPSETNLKNMALAMKKIGPAGEEFVRFLDALGPQLNGLRDLAREGIFPGAEAGITSLMALLPRMERLVREFSGTIGDLFAEAGENLAGPKFEAFFDYIEREAKPMLTEMGHTMGNFVDGFAAMLVAFDPLSRRFSHGFEGMSKSFAEWAHGLSSSDSFASFVEYVNDAIPMTLDFLDALGEAFAEIIRAAQPVGDVMLPALTGLLNVLDAFMETPLGPYFITAMAVMGAYGRIVALASVTTGGFAKNLAFAGLTSKTLTENMTRLNGELRPTINMTAMKGQWGDVGRAMGRAGIAAGLLAVAMSDLDDQAGLTNTTMLALGGLLTGGSIGLAIGTTAGLVLDTRAATDDLNKALDNLRRDAREPISTTLGFDRLGSDIATAQVALDGYAKRLSGFYDQADRIMSFKDSPLKGIQFAVSRPIDFLLGAKNVIEDIFGKSDYEEAVAEIARSERDYAHLEGTLKKLKIANYDAAAAQAMLNSGMSEAEVAANLQAKALEASRAEARKTADEFLKFSDSLDDKKVGLNAWITEMEDAAYALERFRVNAKLARDNNVKKGLIDQLLGEGPAGALRLQQLADATPDQVKRANAAFKEGQRQAKLYTDAIGGTPKDAKTDVEINGIDLAIGKMNTLRELLNLPPVTTFDMPTAIRTKIRDYNNLPTLSAGAADGGTVPTTGLGYADRHVYLLADGEEVVSNRYGQADRHRELLKAINANRLADGGTAQRYATAARTPGSAGGFGVSAAELSSLVMQAVNAQRPIYGDVHVQPHNYSEFVREQKQDMARVAGGGLRR